MTFGEKLKKLRTDKNLTQDELAEKIYVTRTAISKWETDKGYPSIDSLKQLSNLFEVSIDELISLTSRLLSDDPLFFLVNSYTTGLSPMTMSYLLELKVKSRFGGKIEAGELGLRVTQTKAFLPCGASTRWFCEIN